MNEEQKTDNWVLRKPDGSTYGPVGIEVLKQWACDGRIAPEDEVSSDGKNWKPVAEIPALEMRWEVLLADGGQYGPLNVLAIAGLLLDGSVTYEDRVRERGSSDARPVVEVVLAALQEERARLLAQLEDERSAWEVLLENERRSAQQREKVLQEKLGQSRGMLKELAAKLEQIEGRLRDSAELEARVSQLEKENTELRARVQAAGKSGGAEPVEGKGGGSHREEAPTAPPASERPQAAVRKSARRRGGKRDSGGHPGIRLSADDVR